MVKFLASSPYTSSEHLEATKACLSDEEFGAAINYIESETVGLSDLEIDDDPLLMDTLAAITNPYLDEVTRVRAISEALGVTQKTRFYYEMD